MSNQRSLTLTAQQWQAIDRLAITTDSRSTGGPRATVGKHSWRAMMRRIGAGELWVIDPNDMQQDERESYFVIATQGGAE